MYPEIQAIFRELFDNPNLVVGPETTAADVEGWDSLAHAELIRRVEKHFGVKFKLRQVLNFANVGDMVRCIEQMKS
ncbi:MAG: acyl carrier protein [Bacteroidia bacterium]|nr:acyl carrier protein [Bacteroidia bacterium]MDW8333912.1 acyl carrier protein [Bacteroidia bacterium]